MYAFDVIVIYKGESRRTARRGLCRAAAPISMLYAADHLHLPMFPTVSRSPPPNLPNLPRLPYALVSFLIKRVHSPTSRGIAAALTLAPWSA